MKITSLVENTSAAGLPSEHGLSLYIQMGDGQNVLFDMGQRCLFAENAERLGLSIADVDTAIISHGHYDHGGGLRRFLELNGKAKVYIHQYAFQPHYSLRDTGLAFIGIDKDLANSDRVSLCGNIEDINDKMLLFADVQGNCCCPRGNRLLFEVSSTFNYDGRGQLQKNPKQEKPSSDTFRHEQNLVIEEGKNVVLFAGCAHNGIVNIIRKAEAVLGKMPTHVLGGMHLVKSGLNEEEENAFIASLAKELMNYKNTKFYTMHCTGTEQYQKLKAAMGTQISYLSCGESIEI